MWWNQYKTIVKFGLIRYAVTHVLNDYAAFHKNIISYAYIDGHTLFFKNNSLYKYKIGHGPEKVAPVHEK